MAQNDQLQFKLILLLWMTTSGKQAGNGMYQFPGLSLLTGNSNNFFSTRSWVLWKESQGLQEKHGHGGGFRMEEEFSWIYVQVSVVYSS